MFETNFSVTTKFWAMPPVDSPSFPKVFLSVG